MSKCVTMRFACMYNGDREVCRSSPIIFPYKGLVWKAIMYGRMSRQQTAHNIATKHPYRSGSLFWIQNLYAFTAHS